MNIVLDASAAVKIILEKNDDLIEICKSAERLIAPSLYFAEIGNVFVKYHRFDDLEISICNQYIELCRALITDWVEIPDDHESIFHFAIKYELSFDAAIYCVTALNTSSLLLTLDKKLYKVAEDLKINVPLS